MHVDILQGLLPLTKKFGLDPKYCWKTFILTLRNVERNYQTFEKKFGKTKRQ